MFVCFIDSDILQIATVAKVSNTACDAYQLFIAIGIIYRFNVTLIILFIAPTGAQVVELGVRNATIHQVDEKVEVDDLGKLAQIYENILEGLLLD